MTVFIAALAGIATFVGLNFVFAFACALVGSSSQFMAMLLSTQPFKLVIQIVGWSAIAWAGLSVFDAMGGM